MKDDRREQFLKGETDMLRLGGYGGTVYAQVVNGRVRVRVASVPRRQETLGPDSPEWRRTAVEVAVTALRKLRKNAAPQAVGELTPPVTPSLPIREIWTTYLFGRAAMPPEALWWGRRQIVDELAGRPLEARKRAPTPDSINNIVQTARRLHRGVVLRFDRAIDVLEGGDLDNYVNARLTAGASPETLRADLGRFRTAIRYMKRKRPRRWAGRIDPTEAMDPVQGRQSKPPEVGEERARLLIATLEEHGNWRAHAAAVLALWYGRRIGAIGGRRLGLHMDGKPLTRADFRRGEDGQWRVRWRAEAAKGDGFGRGDVWIECPTEVGDLIVTLDRRHPNPRGPHEPLLWSPQDPTRSVSYEALSHALHNAWDAAIEEPRPSGLGWHGFCRTAVTATADAYGTLAAAELTGRSEQVVLKRYKCVRSSHQSEVVRGMERIRTRPRERREERAS